MGRVEVVTVSNPGWTGTYDQAEAIGEKYGEVFPVAMNLEIRVEESKRDALVAELIASGYSIIEGE